MESYSLAKDITQQVVEDKKNDNGAETAKAQFFRTPTRNQCPK